MKCNKCNGDGWYIDHSDEHYANNGSGDCSDMGCPIQRQCESCKGGGEK